LGLLFNFNEILFHDKFSFQKYAQEPFPDVW